MNHMMTKCNLSQNRRRDSLSERDGGGKEREDAKHVFAYRHILI